MNERIFEIAKQADIIQWDLLPSGARTPDHESIVKAKKFAELIVAECIEVAGNDWYTPDGWGYTSGQRKAIEFIKEHFGVEE